MIIRSRLVVPMEGEPIENGAVVVSADKITRVGRFDEIRPFHPGEALDLGDRILMPGLINGHCHLDYTMLRGRIPPPRSFSDWIRSINAEKAKLGAQDYLDSINAGFAEAQRFGTTTIANLTAFPDLIQTMDEPLRTWWFGELIDVRNPEQADRIVDSAVESLRSATRWGLAPHAPFTASQRLYARCEKIAREQNLLLTTHLAESQEEMQMFRDADGATFSFLKDIGRPMDDCGKETPVSLFLGTRTVGARWIIAHLNEITAGDLELLSAAPKFQIAHCPRSHRFFAHARFAIERLRALGFNICLGTDSLASNSSLSLFAEMRELMREESGVSPRQAVEMATVNGAAAIGQRDSLGKISPGACADLIALPIAPGSDVFENIVEFEKTVPWMMVNGVVLSAA